MRLRYSPPRMPGTTSQSAGRSLLACEGMSKAEIESILDAAEHFNRIDAVLVLDGIHVA